MNNNIMIVFVTLFSTAFIHSQSDFFKKHPVRVWDYVKVAYQRAGISIEQQKVKRVRGARPLYGHCLRGGMNPF